MSLSPCHVVRSAAAKKATKSAEKQGMSCSCAQVQKWDVYAMTSKWLTTPQITLTFRKKKNN